MIDREKVIDWIGKCESQFIGCSLAGKCPYWTDKPDEYCWDRLMHDARELLKVDQTYLLDKDEKIKKLHLLLNAKLSAQPLIQKLTERLHRIADIAGDYDNYPTRNGLELARIEIQEIAMRGLQEVKDD